MKTITIELPPSWISASAEHIIQQISGALNDAGIMPYKVFPPENAVFPNGFNSWIETYHEIVSFITARVMGQDPNPASEINQVLYTEGTKGLYSLARTYADKFEAEHTGWDWDSFDFFDTIQEWIEKEYVGNGKPKLKKYKWSVSTSKIWLNFDSGVIEAESIEEATFFIRKLVREKITQANELLKSIGEEIGIDLSQIEVTEIK